MSEPPVTVVLNLYNEQETVLPLLRQLETQTLVPSRVVVVDDGSEDATVGRVKDYVGSLPIELHELDHVGLAPARYFGLRLVREGIAVVVDADMTMQPDWLRELAAVFVDERVGAAYSHVVASGDSFWQRGGQAVRQIVRWVKSRSSPWMAGAGMAIRAEVLAGMDLDAHELVAEDLELSAAVRGSGLEVAAADNAAVTTVDPASVSEVSKRHLQIGRRTWHLMKAHPAFATRLSNVGRFWPMIVLSLVAVSPRLAIAVELAFSGLLAGIMRRQGVPTRSWPAGLATFHVQTAASSAGFVAEAIRSMRREDG